MSSSLAVLALVAVLYSAGIYLLLDRSLTRVLLGVLVLGNATNLLVVAAGGPPGSAPFVGRSTGPQDGMAQNGMAQSDPLVQALVLTAVVITLGVAALVLSLIHRSWTLEREDDLTEDPEDRSVRRRLEGLDPHDQTEEDELDTTGCEEVSDTDDERTPDGHVTATGGS